MPHDLDVERRERQKEREIALSDRAFIFGGETFTHVRDCPWDTVHRAAELEDPDPGVDVLGEIATLCAELIEPGDENVNHDRFWKLLRRKEDPITVDDLSALLRWLMGAASGRPTLPPSPSPDGSTVSGTVSTVASSATPAEVSTS